jgi:SAM-dependent methyltransferase
VADAERLPFADRSLDIAYVHDGWHHVEYPLVVIRELARVARRAVSVNEPAAAALTKAAVRVGLALEREEAGNQVRRLDLDEVAGTLRAAGLEILVAERYATLYRHEPGPASRLLSRRRLLPLARQAQLVAGGLAGRFGNKLTVQARRVEP